MREKREEKLITDAETIKKMMPAEKKAVEILAKNPDMNNHQIGKELRHLGLTKDNSYVLKRLKSSEILRIDVFLHECKVAIHLLSIEFMC